MRIILASAILAGAAPAIAEPVLWQNVEAGMPISKLKELYPESKSSPKVRWQAYAVVLPSRSVGDCLADVAIKTDRKLSEPAAVVTSVELEGYGCANATFRSLVAKYGEPADNLHRGNVKGLSAGNDEIRDMLWTIDGKTIRFKSEHGGIVSNWTLKYEAIKDLGL